MDAHGNALPISPSWGESFAINAGQIGLAPPMVVTMPILHPDPPRLPEHLHSEKEVLAALRTLPPNAHVFTRLSILDPQSNKDREIDFLVIHPELGLVIVEVKGRGVEPDGNNWIRRYDDGHVETLHETPGQQMVEQQYALMRFLRQASPGFIPEITRVLALPYLPLRDDQSLGPDLPACRILTRSKLKSPFETLREAVTGGVPWACWRDSPDAQPHKIWADRLAALVNALTPALLPTPTLAEILADEGRLQDDFNRKLLDHLAQNFCRGRFHVRGGPGSGKSLIARQAARLWASEGRRVLIVAFNKAITYATQSALDGLIRENLVGVTYYHDLAINLLTEAGQPPEHLDDDSYYGQSLPDGLARLLSEAPDSVAERWDALIVDEAQDLNQDWVLPLLALLRNPTQDPVLILEDPAQSIYRKTSHDLGQLWRLDLSLRQHPAIRRAAWQAFPACGWEAPNVPDPDGVVRRISTTHATWKRDLRFQLTDLAKEGIRPDQVMILAPHRPGTIGIQEGEILGPWPVNTVVDWWEEDKAEQVRFSTVFAFKGLEADVVIYLEPGYPHEEAGPLAYTAYSRARHRLIVLEKAIPKPPKPCVSIPVAAIPLQRPAKPPERPQIRHFSDEQRGLLLSALTAAKKYRPGLTPTLSPRNES